MTYARRYSLSSSWLGRHVGQDRTAAPFLVLKIALAEFLAGPAEAGLQPPVESWPRP
jgi:hypothetical protein